MVEVTLGGETLTVEANDWQKAADELVERHGLDGGYPKVERVGGPVVVAESALALVPDPPASEPEIATTHAESGHSLEGEIRSGIDELAAIDAGFSPAQPLYRRGTKVIQWGVDNAKASRLEHDAKPLVGEMCDTLIETVKAEKRHDKLVPVRDIRMSKAGEIALPDRERLLITTQAFPGLCNRMGFGGASYLEKCWAELRAINVNRWALKISEDEVDTQIAAAQAEEKPFELSPRELNLRLRSNPNAKRKEIFGVVSPKYAAFDVDKIAAAIKLAVPAEARGTVTYDGYQARFEVMFHSNVQASKYVAGEFFKAGIIIGTNDIGGGSVWGDSAVWQNLCLNLLIIDRAKKGIFRLRHLGSVEELAKKFKIGMADALKSLDHFLTSWDYAVEENVIERTSKALEEALPADIEEAMRGIFNGILERDLVPVPGRKAKAVPKLMEMWAMDESAAQGPTRAGVVNAFTRYAHTVDMPTPFYEDEIQRAAGRLLYGRGKGNPAPLPFVPFENKTTQVEATA